MASDKLTPATAPAKLHWHLARLDTLRDAVAGAALRHPAGAPERAAAVDRLELAASAFCRFLLSLQRMADKLGPHRSPAGAVVRSADKLADLTRATLSTPAPHPEQAKTVAALLDRLADLDRATGSGSVPLPRRQPIPRGPRSAALAGRSGGRWKTQGGGAGKAGGR